MMDPPPMPTGDKLREILARVYAEHGRLGTECRLPLVPPAHYLCRLSEGSDRLPLEPCFCPTESDAAELSRLGIDAGETVPDDPFSDLVSVKTIIR